MATQSGESPKALAEDETRDRDDNSQARHIRQNGPARVHGSRKPPQAGVLPTHGCDRTRQPPQGNLHRALSRAMVGLYKEYVGRGPTRARAYIQEDVITIVLNDTMTKAERTLAAEGEGALLRDVQRVIRDKFREDAHEIVERLTGQHVVAFLSDHNIDEDVAIQTFLLEPGLHRTSRAQA